MYTISKKEMHSVITTSQVSITREYKRNPPRLFSSNFSVHQRLQRSSSSPIKLSLSIRNEELGKCEPTIGDKDGVVIVDHGSRRKESNLMLNDFVTMFRNRTDYQIVEPAHMELAEPTIKDAFRRCAQQGVNRVIVSPFFLLPGRHWHRDIPALVAEAAREHPGISYIISAPLGLHELLVDVMNDRMKHCLSHVAGTADECAMCAGSGRCHLY